MSSIHDHKHGKLMKLQCVQENNTAMRERIFACIWVLVAAFWTGEHFFLPLCKTSLHEYIKQMPMEKGQRETVGQIIKIWRDPILSLLMLCTVLFGWDSPLKLDTSEPMLSSINMEDSCLCLPFKPNGNAPNVHIQFIGESWSCVHLRKSWPYSKLHWRFL